MVQDSGKLYLIYQDTIMCYKLHAHRTWLLQKKLNCMVSVGTATLDHT